MYVIPFQFNNTEYSVLVILQDENLERMKQYDPAEVSIAKVLEQRPALQKLRLRHIHIGYGTESDMQECSRMISEGNLHGALALLSRGFRYRPQDGDHDGPYKSLREAGT
jgi:hypothetical protein